jgi:hypothetical protein
MNLITWQTPAYGLNHATLQCSNGHVHLRDIPKALQNEAEEIVRTFTEGDDSLPPTQARMCEFLETAGLVRAEFNPSHIAYSEIPEDWKERLTTAAESKPTEGTEEAEQPETGTATPPETPATPPAVTEPPETPPATKPKKERAPRKPKAPK